MSEPTTRNYERSLRNGRNLHAATETSWIAILRRELKAMPIRTLIIFGNAGKPPNPLLKRWNRQRGRSRPDSD